MLETFVKSLLNQNGLALRGDTGFKPESQIAFTARVPSVYTGEEATPQEKLKSKLDHVCLFGAIGHG